MTNHTNHHISHRTVVDHPSTNTETTSSTTTAPPSVGVPPKSGTPGRGRNPVSAVGIILGAAAVVGIAALVADAVTESNPSPQVEFSDATTSQQLVEQSIADAAAARSAADAAAGRSDFTVSQQLVEQSIADAQAAPAVATIRNDFTVSQQLVEQSIADAAAAQSPYDRVEANRVAVLGDLAGAPADDEAPAIRNDFTVSQQLVEQSIADAAAAQSPYDRVEANRVAVLGDLAGAPAGDEAPAIRNDFTVSQQLVEQSISEVLAE